MQQECAGDGDDYILCHEHPAQNRQENVDDILVFSKEPMPIINAIKKDYILKGMEVPEYYFGCVVLELVTL